MGNKPFCAVPFVQAFTTDRASFRNCCSTSPAINSIPNQTFSEWQQDPRLIEFQKNMYTEQWSNACQNCRIQEEQSGSSFRTAINDAIEIDENFELWPSRWNIAFGNVCNLGCWICDEYSSSVIAQHKKIINILPNNFVDPDKTFETHWKNLEPDVLKSYDYHKIITLTILGGEPLFNKTVDRFLTRLKDLGLSSRTKLEFFTNGTKINKTLFSKGTWNYISIFLSLDAIGKKAEWLRYGCNWSNIKNNLEFFKSVSNYIEILCTLSILNIHDLPELKLFCDSEKLPLKISTLDDPKFMSIFQWSGDKDLVTDRDYLEKYGFEYYYDLIGTQSNPTSVTELKKYIEQFDSIRKPLSDYDSRLYRAINSQR